MEPIVDSPFSKKLRLIVILLVPVVGACSANAHCAHGDLDGSESVDLTDCAAFVDCASGPAGGPLHQSE